MQRIKKLFIGVCGLLATLVMSGCSFHTAHANRMDATAYLSKEMQLPNDMLLAETKHWSPSNTGRYWVFSFAQTPYHTNYINATIPTHEQYKEHPQQWQRWHGDTMTGWSRMVGLLDKGTQFHITDITPKGQGNGYWVIVEFDSGEHKGKTAIYANSKNLIPGMYT